MPLTTQQLIIAYGIPAVLAVVVMLLAWRPWSSATPRGHWAAGVAIGLGAAINLLGLAHQFKPPGLPPTSSVDWLFHFGWMLAVLAVVDALLPIWGEVRSMLMLALATAAAYLLVWRIADQWQDYQALVRIGLWALGATLTAVLIERTSEKQPGGWVPLVLLICAAGMAPWPLLRGSADFTFRAGVLTVVLLPIAAIAWWGKRPAFARGGGLSFAVVYGAAILTAALLISDVPRWQAYTLALAPIVSVAALWLPLGGWKRPAIAMGLAVIMTASVLIPSYLEWKRIKESNPWASGPALLVARGTSP